MNIRIEGTYAGRLFDGTEYSVERGDLRTDMERFGEFTTVTPFSSESFPYGHVALKLPRTQLGPGRESIQREFQVYRHIAQQPARQTVGLGAALGGDVDGGHLVLEHYHPAVQLSDQRLLDWDASDKFEIGDKLFRAVDSLMRLGLVHQDITPNNVLILVDRKGAIDLRLIDFGHAFRTESVLRGEADLPQAANRDWCHPDRLTAGGSARASHYTDMWEAVLSWLSLWSGSNHRDALASQEIHARLPTGLHETLLTALNPRFWTIRGPSKNFAREVAKQMWRSSERQRKWQEISVTPAFSGDSNIGYRALEEQNELLIETVDDDYRAAVLRWISQRSADLTESSSDEERQSAWGPLEIGNTMRLSTIYEGMVQVKFRRESENTQTTLEVTARERISRRLLVAVLAICLAATVASIAWISSQGFNL